MKTSPNDDLLDSPPIYDPCGCIEKVNKSLVGKSLSLRLSQFFNTHTGECTREMCIETVTTKRGATKVPLLAKYCPFCGKQRYPVMVAVVQNSNEPSEVKRHR